MPTKRKKQTRGKGPRSSQRAKGLPTETNVVPKPLRVMGFPIELQNAILAGLDKSDLKNVRLVCHHWALLAVNFLFDKVYISATKKDLDVFRMVSELDTICKAVRMLVYDVSTFSPIRSLQDYYFDLHEEFIDVFPLSEDISRQPFENSTRPFHRFLNYLAQAQDMDDEMNIQHNHENKAYILEGYRAWQAHAQFEDYSMKGLLSRSLSSGLSRMNRLHSVALTSDIFLVNLLETESIDLDTLHCEYLGSPLSRSWNPLHLRPKGINPNNDPNGILEKHFQNMIYALDRSAPPIIQLSLLEDRNAPSVWRHSGLSRTILQTLLASKGLHSLTLKTCRWLESFSLCIVTPYYGDWCGDPIALGILPKLLREMQNLKHLQLGSMWKTYMTDTERYNYKQIFSKSCRWPQLESLSISGLAFENHEFVHLTREQLPRLCRLEICRIDLLSGTWEAAVEFLRSSVCIKKLSYPHGVFHLTHQDGHLFDGGRRLPNTRLLRDPRAKDFSDRISHYVVHGGRHPCLPPGCEPSAAAGYLPSLWPHDNGFSDPGSIARLTPLEHYH